ncbi:MAG: YoaK family protein [Filifactoraceae bacterium]
MNRDSQAERQLDESNTFVVLLMIVGGFLNAYTFITRGGVFANNQTGNFARLGIELATKNWRSAADCLFPIIGCICGSAVASYIKMAHFPNKPNHWRRTILALEFFTLLIIGFIPETVPDRLVTVIISFITSFQLTGFRTWHGILCATTIASGNLRAAGQFYAEAIVKKDKASLKKAFQFSCVVFSFVLGAFLGTFASFSLGVRAVWICCFIILFLIYRIASVLHLPLTQ